MKNQVKKTVERSVKVCVLFALFVVLIPKLPAQKSIKGSDAIKQRIEDLVKLSETEPDSAVFAFEKLYQSSLKAKDYYGMIKSSKKLHKIFVKKGNYDSARYYLERSSRAARKSENRAEICKAQNDMGWFMVLKGEYKKAIEFADSALNYTKISDFEKATAYNTLAASYQFPGSYSKSIEYYYKGLKILEKTNNKYGTAVTYNNIAAIHNAQENYQKSLELYRKAKRILEKEKLESLVAPVLNNIASIHLKTQEYDSAKHYYKIAYKKNKRIENKIELARTASNLGQLYYELKDFEKAWEFLSQAIEIFEKSANKTDLAICYKLQAMLYAEKEQYSKAEETLNQAWKFASENSTYESMLDILRAYTKLYSKQGFYKKALSYRERHENLKDSIFNIKKAKAFENIKTMYEIEQKEERIKLLEAEKKVDTVKRYILAVALFAIFLLLLILFFNFRLRQRNAQRKLKLLKEEQRADKLELDKNQLLLEKRDLANKNLKDQLLFKEKELATNAMHIIQKNEANIKTVKELTKIKKQLPASEKKSIEQISKLINRITVNEKDDIWKEFEIRFTQVHENFYQTLNEKFPELTPNERKLSAFLKLNMTTKEISMITHQSPNSIRVARTRLRKKLNLTADDDLYNFLNRI